MNHHPYRPDWSAAVALKESVCAAASRDVDTALSSENPSVRDLAVLLSPAAGDALEKMARRAQLLTRKHFGRTMQLYAPLYLSSYCSSLCAYCGFAADHDIPRHKMSLDEIAYELQALREMKLDEILLLTGERTAEANVDYIEAAVEQAARSFDLVQVEVFPMEYDEYTSLARKGCSGLTLYQETYDADQYKKVHKKGRKADYEYRIESPARALAAGFRFAGLGCLLGLSDPVSDMLCLFEHVQYLRKKYWRAGLSVSFPRIRPVMGGFQPDEPVGDRLLAQIIFAFRICLPDIPLVLSTREAPSFRDGMAGLGISKMSVASRTTVGGYGGTSKGEEEQFRIYDDRDTPTFCRDLRQRNLEPVFKNWDSVYRTSP